MEHIASLRDLEDFGIVPLTGEADSLGFRILCDLTERGRKIVARTYGLREDGFEDNWNNGSELVPHVASVMLSGDAWESIGVLCLLDKGCHTVLVTADCLYGLIGEEGYDRGEAHWDEATESVIFTRQPRVHLHGDWIPWSETLHGKVRRIVGYGPGPRVGDRNVHAFSGRAA